jgi:hypothetical protein
MEIRLNVEPFETETHYNSFNFQFKCLIALNQKDHPKCHNKIKSGNSNKKRIIKYICKLSQEKKELEKNKITRKEKKTSLFSR